MRAAGYFLLVTVLGALAALNPLLCTCPVAIHVHQEREGSGGHEDCEGGPGHPVPDIHPAQVVIAGGASADSDEEGFNLSGTGEPCGCCHSHERKPPCASVLTPRAKAPPPECMLASSYGLKAPPAI